MVLISLAGKYNLGNDGPLYPAKKSSDAVRAVIFHMCSHKKVKSRRGVAVICFWMPHRRLV